MDNSENKPVESSPVENQPVSSTPEASTETPATTAESQTTPEPVSTPAAGPAIARSYRETVAAAANGSATVSLELTQAWINYLGKV